jgi:hypothetical protein
MSLLPLLASILPMKRNSLPRHLQSHFKSAKESADYLEVLDQLKDWLFAHTEGADKEFAGHLKAAGVDSILAAWNEPKSMWGGLAGTRRSPLLRPSIRPTEQYEPTPEAVGC